MDALAFFDGLTRDSFRWERLTVFRLLLLGFINAFGYEHQKSPQSHLDAVAQYLKTPDVANTFSTWVPKLGLGADQEAQGIRAALAKVAAVS